MPFFMIHTFLLVFHQHFLGGIYWLSTVAVWQVTAVSLACFLHLLFGEENTKFQRCTLQIWQALAEQSACFFGRVANFINGELWGKKFPNQTEAPWWSVKYPAEITEVWVNNTDQYGDKLVALEPLKTTIVSGSDAFYQQIVIEAYAGNTVVIETIAPQLTAWYPSQLFQAISDGPLLLGALILVWLVPRKPGIVSGSFLVVYGILRILTEVFRQPDEGVSIIFGLARGQLLSVCMVLVGAVMILICAKKWFKKIWWNYSN